VTFSDVWRSVEQEDNEVGWADGASSWSCISLSESIISCQTGKIQIYHAIAVLLLFSLLVTSYVALFDSRKKGIFLSWRFWYFLIPWLSMPAILSASANNSEFYLLRYRWSFERVALHFQYLCCDNNWWSRSHNESTCWTSTTTAATHSAVFPRKIHYPSQQPWPLSLAEALRRL